MSRPRVRGKSSPKATLAHDVVRHECLAVAIACCYLTTRATDMPNNDDGTVTPEELARELGVTGRTIRAYLRSKHGVLPPFVTRWHLDPERAADVRANVRSTTAR